MSKYGFLFGSILFICFVTLIANQMQIYNVDDITKGITNDLDFNLSGIRALLQTYLSIITFKIPGFPPILNILIFIPINILAIYLLLEIVKDILPF